MKLEIEMYLKLQILQGYDANNKNWFEKSVGLKIMKKMECERKGLRKMGK